MPPASTARSDALALGLSLGAAATSAYVLWKTTQAPKQAPTDTDKKLEKKLKQQARSRKIESLIMERGQAGAHPAPKPNPRHRRAPSYSTQVPKTTASTSWPRARRT